MRIRRAISSAGPAAPAIAISEWSSVGSTFSMSREATRLPSVASRSPATTTPSAYLKASTVVPCGRRSGSRPAWTSRPHSGSNCVWSLASSSMKLEPRYLPPTLIDNVPPSSCDGPEPEELLAAPLDVVLHELLGVLLEDLVDLVHQGVHLLLELLAALGELLGAGGVALLAFPAAPLGGLLLGRIGRAIDREPIGRDRARRLKHFHCASIRPRLSARRFMT